MDESLFWSNPEANYGLLASSPLNNKNFVFKYDKTKSLLNKNGEYRPIKFHFRVPINKEINF